MKNVQLRKSYRDKPCIVCGDLPSDFCHIQTYATTLKDDESNGVQLCRNCHRVQHQMGIVSFAEAHPKYYEHVKKLGFEIVNIFGIKKLRRNA